MVGLVVASWLALQVAGAGSCPAPAEVEERLAPLFPAGFAISSTDQASMVEEADGTLSVSLARPDGRAIARRRLPRAATCGEQAQTVAVALAVWEAQIHPEISLRLESLTAPPRAVPPPRAGGDAVLERSAANGAARPVTIGVGAAVMGGWQPGSLAPGARLDGTLGRASGPWRARVSLAGLGTHTESLPPGQAQWWRLYVAVGGDYVVPLSPRWDLALGAAGVLGLATVEGAGFTADRTTRTADLGLEWTLRVDRRLGRLRPWLGLVVVTWMRRQTLEVTGTGASLALPLAEPMLALGADFDGPP